jgi:glycosyltransferase involved in cell wall biosynthesis
VKVLAVSNFFPKPGAEFAGIFVRREVLALRALGVEVEELETSYRRAPLTNWAAFRERVRESRADLVNVYFGSLGAFGAALACPRPLVLTFGGSDLFGRARRDPLWEQMVSATAATLSQISAPNADAVVVRSERLRQALLLGHERSRATVIPAGVDTTLFRPMDRATARGAVGWGPAATVVLFAASRHRPIKRFDLAMATIERLGTLGVKARLESLERIPPDRMPYYFNAADCAILTSQHEGSPNAIKEAVACGCPVVAVPVGDVPEILRDVTPSRVTDPDPEPLAAALKEVLTEGRRSNGPDRIRAAFSLDVTAKRLRQVYEDTLAGWNAGRRYGWRRLR